MARRWRPPHPAKVLRPPMCPPELQRFASVDLARTALLYGLAPTGLTAVACERCGGAHHQPTPAKEQQ
jgi:hypothetical protein